MYYVLINLSPAANVLVVFYVYNINYNHDTLAIANPFPPSTLNFYQFEISTPLTL